MDLPLWPFFNDYTDIRSLGTNAASNNAFVFQKTIARRPGALNFPLITRLRIGGGCVAATPSCRSTLPSKQAGATSTVAVLRANDPENQVILQSMIDLPWHLEFDCNFGNLIHSLPRTCRVTLMVDLRLVGDPVKPRVLPLSPNTLDAQTRFGAAPTARKFLERFERWYGASGGELEVLTGSPTETKIDHNVTRHVRGRE